MPHFSDAEVHGILSARFRSGSGTDYIGLSTTLPTDEVDGNINEPVGMGYARVALPRTSASWAAPTLRAITTVADVEFAPASGDWEVIEAWVMFDSATGGNAVTAGRITAVDVSDGDTALLPAGSITILAP